MFTPLLFFYFFPLKFQCLGTKLNWLEQRQGEDELSSIGYRLRVIRLIKRKLFLSSSLEIQGDHDYYKRKVNINVWILSDIIFILKRRNYFFLMNDRKLQHFRITKKIFIFPSFPPPSLSPFLHSFFLPPVICTVLNCCGWGQHVTICDNKESTHPDEILDTYNSQANIGQRK